MLKFTKMHGIGNDYVYIDAIKQKIENPNELAKKLSDRRYSIGGTELFLFARVMLQMLRCVCLTLMEARE